MNSTSSSISLATKVGCVSKPEPDGLSAAGRGEEYTTKDLWLEAVLSRANVGRLVISMALTIKEE